MWDKYLDYTKAVENMIRFHDDNMTALRSLREQYAEMGDNDGLKAIQYDADPVQTSATPDALVNRVIRKESVAEKIRELETENRQFEMVWRRKDRMTNAQQRDG